jgi:membrane fusion protein, multidrug efflux system
VSQQAYDNAAAAQDQAIADVTSAKAAVDTARINLVYTRVLSPISGRSGRSSVTEGALVDASQSTALVVVQQLDPIYVDVTQPSTMLLRVQREFASGQMKEVGHNQAGTGPPDTGGRHPLRADRQAAVRRSHGPVRHRFSDAAFGFS